MNEFPVLAAVLSGIGTASGAFWIAHTTLTKYIDARVESGVKNCKERIDQLEKTQNEMACQIEVFRGANVHFLNIIDLSRHIDDVKAKPIIAEARKGIERLK